jgi:hypothetical protein
MPLNINDVASVVGRSGRAGAMGADGVFEGLIHGQPGGSGSNGGSASIARSTQSFFGDAGQDIVTFSFTVEGGVGGGGGFGGTGARGVTNSFTQTGPTFFNSFTNYGPNGDGGAGGRGGVGGLGNILFESLQFDLASQPGGADQINFFAQATGGSGGSAGSGGRGFSGGGAGLNTNQYGTPGNFFTETLETTGHIGGISGRSGEVRGALVGRVNFEDVTILADQLFMRIEASARGGRGGNGALELAHGSGVTAPDAWDGRDGTAGALGHARVNDLTVTATGQLDLSILLDADGGTGGSGGFGGNAAPGYTGSSIRTYPLGVIGPSTGSGTSNTIYAEAGNGGNGGAGGTALAVMANARITGSANADFVTIDLRATGGNGGVAGQGGTGAADSIVVQGNPGEYLHSYVVRGTPDGDDGVSGAAGASLVRLLDSRIELGDGPDQLNLRFAADGAGARSTIVARNHFDGGLGRDTITVGDLFTDGQPSVFFNVRDGRVFFDGGPLNTHSGFEVFWGGSGDDRFLDGVGSQVYRGRGGDNRYEFFARQDGADRIEDFSGDDVIVLRGFGPSLNDFADVLAASTQQRTGVLIQTSPTSSIFLSGVLLVDLQATDFLF